VAWLASVFTAFYMLRATVSVFYGEMPSWLRERTVEEASPSMQAGMGILALLCVVFGVAPQLLMTWVVDPAVRSLGFASAVQVSWLGVQLTSAGAQVTAGAVIALVAVMAGLALYRLAQRPRVEPVGLFTGGDPLPSADARVGAVDFVDIAQVAFQPVYKATDPDPFYLALWSVVKRLCGRVDVSLTPLGERHALAATFVAAAVVFVVVWAL
jgi:NADH:ubiquinone oxidoreductase subunit 5 (subunit L)/multisubunit Na+/H+ antiporter MnhA subunit